MLPVLALSAAQGGMDDPLITRRRPRAPSGRSHDARSGDLHWDRWGVLLSNLRDLRWFRLLQATMVSQTAEGSPDRGGRGLGLRDALVLATLIVGTAACGEPPEVEVLAANLGTSWDLGNPLISVSNFEILAVDVPSPVVFPLAADFATVLTPDIEVVQAGELTQLAGLGATGAWWGTKALIRAPGGGSGAWVGTTDQHTSVSVWRVGGTQERVRVELLGTVHRVPAGDVVEMDQNAIVNGHPQCCSSYGHQDCDEVHKPICDAKWRQFLAPSLTYCGDMTGDGVDDLCMGGTYPFIRLGRPCEGSEPERCSAHYATVFSLEERSDGETKSLQATPEAFIENGPSPTMERYGTTDAWTIAGGMDLTGDGANDLVVGEFGAFQVFAGPLQGVVPSTAAVTSMPAVQPGEGETRASLRPYSTRSGYHLAYWHLSVIDANEDGIGDIAVSQNKGSVVGTTIRQAMSWPTRASIFFGPFTKATENRPADLQIVDPLNEDWLGIWDLADIGDYNGDGHRDLAISERDQGRVRVFFGPHLNHMDVNRADLTIERESPWFGRTLTGGVDFDGDGCDELIVSETRAAAVENPATGRMYVYDGC
jgi:hypothetical protein